MPQILRAYSRTVRSEENSPIAAMLRIAVDASLRDLVDEFVPDEGPVGSWSTLGGDVGGGWDAQWKGLRGNLVYTTDFDHLAASFHSPGIVGSRAGSQKGMSSDDSSA